MLQLFYGFFDFYVCCCFVSLLCLMLSLRSHFLVCWRSIKQNNFKLLDDFVSCWQFIFTSTMDFSYGTFIWVLLSTRLYFRFGGDKCSKPAPLTFMLFAFFSVVFVARCQKNVCELSVIYDARCCCCCFFSPFRIIGRNNNNNKHMKSKKGSQMWKSFFFLCFWF